jgi:hypothetical protein
LASDDDHFDCVASAIPAAHHVGDKIHSQTVVVDSGATRHMFYDLSVSQKLEFIAPTTVKLGDDSTTDCTQIGEVVLNVSDGRRIRLTQVLYVPRLAINLLSVSQLAKKGIMTSFTKIGCTLLDTAGIVCWQRRVLRLEVSKSFPRQFIMRASLLVLLLPMILRRRRNA